MLNSKGFDLWSDDYDKTVNLSEEANEYPFAGYKSVLNEIYNIVHNKADGNVLDIGFGTGVLTQKLYDDGYNISGIDFSIKMVEIASTKMPNAIFIKHDFTLGLPKELSNKKFDFIISTYAIHHLTDEYKVIFIKKLLASLNKDGGLLIGDVAFETRAELDKCKKKCGDGWDSDEIYIVFDEIKKYFPNIIFNKISHCAGVFCFQK